MKKLLAIALSLCLALTLGLSVVGCKQESKAEAASFVSVDINPSIELTLDAKNKVISVCGANEDGQVLLYGEASLVGLDVEAAVEKITALAIELGYLDQDNAVVETSVSAKSEKLAEDIKSKISQKIKAASGDLEITVSSEGVYSLIRKYERFIAEHPDCEINIDQFKLALSASQTGEISLEAAVNLDNEKLIKIVSDSHEKIANYATKAFDKAKIAAETAFLTAEGIAMDSLYVKYSLIKGSMYNAYKNSARMLDCMAKTMILEEDLDNYPLSEESVSAIAQALGISDISPLKNSDGEITVNSIYEYLDKYFKNAADDDAAQIKAQIDQSLSTIESEVSGLIKNQLAKYVDQMDELIGDLAIPGIDLADGISAAEIKIAADYFDDLAEDLAVEIEKELTESQKKALADDREQLESAIKNLKDQMNSAIEQAKTAAQNKLTQIKEGKRQDKNK